MFLDNPHQGRIRQQLGSRDASHGRAKQFACGLQRLCTHGNGSASRALGRCFDDESHNKDCNRNGSTEVSNVRVESFHAASGVCMSLLFFLSPVAKA